MSAPPWYEAANFFVLRVPLLPVQAYEDLVAHGGVDTAHEPAVLRALAVASDRFLDVLSTTRRDDRRRRKVDAALLRYLIRMATRPTPFGLFAGVAVGRWDRGTDLRLIAGGRQQRTRPDLGLLLRLVHAAEADPAIRRHLDVVANPAARIRAGRVLLDERVSRGDATVPPAVSIRATGVVRRALAAARRPIAHGELVDALVEATPGATTAQVDGLVTMLWEQTLLLTALRPPLTVADPAQYVVERLADIPAAGELCAALRALLVESARWDQQASVDGVASHRRLAAAAADLAPVERLPLQVDSSVALASDRLASAVANEAACAVQLLLRMSPRPTGSAPMAAYRRRFEQRYGSQREVPLLDLLDPEHGLGPPSAARSTVDPLGGTVWPRRNRRLLELAVRAARERTRSIELDEGTIEELATGDPSAADLPVSVELNVMVAAASAAALDAGDFRMIVAPNVGAGAAGRSLGRFADLVPGAEEQLAALAGAEEWLEPTRLWAELTYQPRALHLGNVSTRPLLRAHEIAVGVSANERARIVPVDELVVGVQAGRLYVRWPPDPRPLSITSGHMLNHLRAPAVARFLAEVGRDGECQLAGFQWGTAETLPFLPRVEVGRVVLSLAQWRLDASAVPAGALDDAVAFNAAVDDWRRRWDVPDRVYLAAGDNRLLLDLGHPDHVEQVRAALRRPGARSAVLTEALPDTRDAWLDDDAGGRYLSEVVVPLVRRAAANALVTDPDPRPFVPTTVHPLGGDWLFVKLYGGEELADDVLTGALRNLVDRALAGALAEEWHFLRYHDPDRHLRVRFRGQPARLLGELLPEVCSCAGELLGSGVLTRFVVDMYEPETERFGGPEGMRAAERFFAADSAAVVELLHRGAGGETELDGVALAVLTVNAILDGLGMEPAARVEWCRRQGADQPASAEFRALKGDLRLALGAATSADDDRVRPIDDVLSALAAAATAHLSTVDQLTETRRLTCTRDELTASLVHLHVNRLLGPDRRTEQVVASILGRVLYGLECSGQAVRRWGVAR